MITLREQHIMFKAMNHFCMEFPRFTINLYDQISDLENTGVNTY